MQNTPLDFIFQFSFLDETISFKEVSDFSFEENKILVEILELTYTSFKVVV